MFARSRASAQLLAPEVDLNADDVLSTARATGPDKLSLEPAELADAVDAFVARGDAASALEVAARTWRVWLRRGLNDEGSAVLVKALAPSGSSIVPIWHARVLYAAGLFAFRAGDQVRSRQYSEKALAAATSTGDARGESDALTGLARVALRDGRYEDVAALSRKARDRARSADDRAAEASPLHLEAAGARLPGRYDEARVLYEESLRLSEGLADERGVAMELHNLGWVELHLGHVDEAVKHFERRDQSGGQEAYDRAWTDLNWAAVAALRGDREEASRRLERARQMLEERAETLDPDDQFELDWVTNLVES